MGILRRNKKAKYVRALTWRDVYGDDFPLPKGYRTLAKCPEIVAGVSRIAQLLGDMTIHFYENKPNGDEIVKDGFSRKIDIEPNAYMTRHNFIEWIVKTLYLEGKGNAFVIPRTKNGLLMSLDPVKPSSVSVDDNAYIVKINGKKTDPSSIMHFVRNPKVNAMWKGEGFTVQLTDVCETLTQASKTRKDFLSSNIMPSLIIGVDADTEELADPDKREAVIQRFLGNKRKGEPAIVPSGLIDIHEVKPLTLKDIAIDETIKLDKKQVACLLGIPSFVLGEGEFKRDEWNNFVGTTIKSIAQIIQQEMTKKLVVSTNHYIAFSVRSLYNYDFKTMIDAGCQLMERGIMTGNEVRDWAGLAPRDGLDELSVLENYIPVDKIGDQKKLIQSE